MHIVWIFLALLVTGISLYKKWQTQWVLFLVGFGMICLAEFFGLGFLKEETSANGAPLLNALHRTVGQFESTLGSVGLMIMSIGGFVTYCDNIGASQKLVQISLNLLNKLKLPSSFFAILVLPLGQILFVCIPSAAGFACLLMASVFPVLVGMGVNRAAAAAIITGTTAFGIGPASAITNSAATIIGIPVVDYFINVQLSVMWAMMAVTMVLYAVSNRIFDRMPIDYPGVASKMEQDMEQVPSYLAVLPILPILLLTSVYLSSSLLNIPMELSTSEAMIASMILAFFARSIGSLSLSKSFAELSNFWVGMGDIFKNVVTLVMAAEIFAKGLISLGFIQMLVDSMNALGLGSVAVLIVFTILIFLASILMGSGNAAFFSFAPTVPKIASEFGLEGTKLILPMNLGASMGRTISPISGVLIAVSTIAQVPVFEILKRNLLPMIGALIFILIYSA
ncbi:MAG: C4-dicarboxylate transporter DcuC [Schleiferiaceae bacterium]|nr:C4-dicarboxylate transporter DcuC [Schleiferiaceae bacterium]